MSRLCFTPNERPHYISVSTLPEPVKQAGGSAPDGLPPSGVPNQNKGGAFILSKQTDTAILRAMLSQPGECDCCPLSETTLLWLLTRYGSYEQAAYQACVMLSQDCAMRMSDGTTAPSQSRYWLNMALSFRPNRGGALSRADCPSGKDGVS